MQLTVLCACSQALTSFEASHDDVYLSMAHMWEAGPTPIEKVVLSRVISDRLHKGFTEKVVGRTVPVL